MQHHSMPFPNRGNGHTYRELVERVPAVMYVDASDKRSSEIYMSSRVVEMLGYTSREWLEDPSLWTKLLHPEDRKRVLTERERTRWTSEPFSAEYRFVAKDGRTVWVRDEAELFEKDGSSFVWHGLLVEVTARKETEAELARNEGRFRHLAGNLEEGIAWVSYKDGLVKYCNPVYAEILGLTPSEIIGRSFSDFLEKADEKETRRQRELITRVGSSYEVAATIVRGERKMLL